jgi:hypothetical protein
MLLRVQLFVRTGHLDAEDFHWADWQAVRAPPAGSSDGGGGGGAARTNSIKGVVAEKFHGFVAVGPTAQVSGSDGGGGGGRGGSCVCVCVCVCVCFLQWAAILHL